MSKVDVNEYKEVAVHALNILQDIMNSPIATDTAKAIAATTVLNHCKSVIESERQQRSYIPNICAKEMEKCIKNVIDRMPDNGGLA
ncbi:hypothetical protein [Brevibacillus massiliensis]|uniref:hypothetical protein n=1 Tax=Brevibacillus massiliensis TaxID=1118054 RepID=UPI000305602B|nr:hypothetical protein [Brevibacillus massiliensis]